MKGGDVAAATDPGLNSDLGQCLFSLVNLNEN
jgi:hypothetical protein